MVYSFFKKASEVFFGGTEAKKVAARKASKKWKRTMRIEELENREMLSATPFSWDPSTWTPHSWDSESLVWWNGVATPNSVPSTFNTSTTSNDFGKISVGGNNAQISATTAFQPIIVGNFGARETVTRQGNVTGQCGNGQTIVVGGFNETFTVAVFRQDLGNNNWNYKEQVQYVYSFTCTSGDYSYEDRFSYILAARSVNGVFNSAFTLTTGMAFSDGFTVGSGISGATGTQMPGNWLTNNGFDIALIETEFTNNSAITDDSRFFWDVSVGYSVTNTATITHHPIAA